MSYIDQRIAELAKEVAALRFAIWVIAFSGICSLISGLCFFAWFAGRVLERLE